MVWSYHHGIEITVYVRSVPSLTAVRPRGEEQDQKGSRCEELCQCQRHVCSCVKLEKVSLRPPFNVATGQQDRRTAEPGLQAFTAQRGRKALRAAFDSAVFFVACLLLLLLTFSTLVASNPAYHNRYSQQHRSAQHSTVQSVRLTFTQAS